jgi:hypothetical protein
MTTLDIFLPSKCSEIKEMALFTVTENFLFKGDMGKQAHALIWVPFFQFLIYFNENFSISFFFQGYLNGAVKFDLTLLHSAYFALHIAHFAPFFQLFCFSS